MVREFSAGGVVLRRFRGRPFMAAIRLRGGTVLALPKGLIDTGESAVDAATREVQEETGLEVRLVDRLGDVRYWYTRRGGERVMKVVTFFLFHYRSGSVRNHDHEVEQALCIPLDEATERLAYKGERDMAAAALSKLARGR